MSSGYTSAFASTAPAEPATALPHGGSFSSLDAPAIVGFCRLRESQKRS